MEATAAPSRATTELKSDATIAELWAGVLVGPLAALLQLQINYALVLWACSHSSSWPLHLVSFLALVLTIIAGLLSFRLWQRSTATEDGAGPVARSRLMSGLGIAISVVMVLLIIAQWIPIFIHDPCER